MEVDIFQLCQPPVPPCISKWYYCLHRCRKDNLFGFSAEPSNYQQHRTHMHLFLKTRMFTNEVKWNCHHLILVKYHCECKAYREPMVSLSCSHYTVQSTFTSELKVEAKKLSTSAWSLRKIIWCARLKGSFMCQWNKPLGGLGWRGSLGDWVEGGSAREQNGGQGGHVWNCGIFWGQKKDMESIFSINPAYAMHPQIHRHFNCIFYIHESSVI